METQSFYELKSLCAAQEAKEATLLYLTGKMRQFVRPQDRVLFCFCDKDSSELETLLHSAVTAIGAKVLTLNGDFRWINILKTAFNTRANVVLGPPLVILGITKLAKVTNTPLYFRQVFTAGAPCLDWMIEGIRRGLDCVSWGCFDPGGAVIAGFSCTQGMGVHLRDDVFDLQIVDDTGNELPDGELGNVVLIHKSEEVYVPLRSRARKETAPCTCGCSSVKLMEFLPPAEVDPELVDIGEELYSWTSVLDCTLNKGENGLELELVVFPGTKLPKLPFCAKKVVRYWEPDTDVPVSYRLKAENS